MQNDDYPTSIRIPRELRDDLVAERDIEQKARGGPRITLSWMIVNIIQQWVEARKARRQ